MIELKGEVSFIKENESKYLSKIHDITGNSVPSQDFSLSEEGRFNNSNEEIICSR